MKKYDTLQSLPEGVAKNLPLQAQEIYKATFNNAIDAHQGEEDAEDIAHRIAWSAVKQTYEQSGSGLWSKK